MEVKRGSVVLFGARLGLSAIGFAATVYFARTLGQRALGIYFTFEAVINVLGLLSRFGITTAVEKRISEVTTSADRYLTGALALATLPLAIVAGATFALSEFVNAYIGVAATLTLIAGVVSANYSSLLLSALRGEGRLVEGAAIEFLTEVLRVGASITLLVNGFGVWSLLYGFVVGVVGRAVISGILLNAGFVLPSRETFTSLVSFSRYAFVSNVSGLAYSWLDTLLLSYFMTKSVVGVYESAWKISVVTLIASTALGTALFPALSRWHSEGRKEYIQNALTEAITFTLILVVPATVGALLLGNEVMRIVYQFSMGGTILMVLVGEKLFQGVVEVLQRVLLGINEARAVFYINIFALATNVAGNIVLIHYFGAVGAAIATLGCSLVALVLSVWFLRAHIEILLDWRALGWEVTAALVMGGVVVIVNDVVRPTSLPPLLLVVVVGAVIYSVLVLSNPDIRESVHSIAT